MAPLSIPRGSIYFKQNICQTRKQTIENSQEVVEFRRPIRQDLKVPYGKGRQC